MSNTTDASVVSSRSARLGRAIRASRGPMTQAQLGERVGRPQATVSTWETGRVVPDLEMVHDLERVLRLRPGQLLVAAGYVALNQD